MAAGRDSRAEHDGIMARRNGRYLRPAVDAGL